MIPRPKKATRMLGIKIGKGRVRQVVCSGAVSKQLSVVSNWQLAIGGWSPDEPII
jgi:hypothetical protein